MTWEDIERAVRILGEDPRPQTFPHPRCIYVEIPTLPDTRRAKAIRWLQGRLPARLVQWLCREINPTHCDQVFSCSHCGWSACIPMLEDKATFQGQIGIPGGVPVFITRQEAHVNIRWKWLLALLKLLAALLSRRTPAVKFRATFGPEQPITRKKER